MIIAQGYQGVTVGVFGLARAGLAAAQSLVAGGARVRAWDDNAEARQRAKALGIELVDFNKTGLEGVSTLFVSPGIAHLHPAPHPIIADAMRRGITIDNDIGLFFRSKGAAKVVCVTGSNGKSTITALLRHILAEAGVPVQMGGNIGQGAMCLNPPKDGEVVILELSSYQTELARTLRPDVALFANFSPDHLDRHGGLGGYFAAKRRLFELDAPSVAVIGLDQKEGRLIANGIEGTLIGVSSDTHAGAWSICANAGVLSEWRGGDEVASFKLTGLDNLRGGHNHHNAAMAYGAARALGVDGEAIRAAMDGYCGLPHRCQVLGRGGGVLFVNDSKATNVEAVAQALAAFERIHWIVGGQNKGEGLAALTPHFGRVKRAYLIGESAADLAADLDGVAQEQCGTLARAVAAAMANAQDGDVILLAPACASFDQFSSFEERGDAFIAEVTPHISD